MAYQPGPWLSICGVLVLISFLSYSSQYLFAWLDPVPLTARESLTFNTLVICMLICYARACMSNPGKLLAMSGLPKQPNKGRWCRKCEQQKPPRWHHCKTCERCIPKMDHHCVWIANCVSHCTFPHFIRFLFFAVCAMLELEYFIFGRAKYIWDRRAMPSYLGPSLAQLIHLLMLIAINSLTLFALAVLLGYSVWSLTTNVTAIEEKEIERHESLIKRAKRNGGYVSVPGGGEMLVERQEFPYDIGIWQNMVQGMGTKNPLVWIFPLASSPDVSGAFHYETNGFEEESKTWPPPDPDRRPAEKMKESSLLSTTTGAFSKLDIESFRRRQEQDLKRFDKPNGKEP